MCLLADDPPRSRFARETRKPGVHIARSKQLFSGLGETVFEPPDPGEDPTATSPVASSGLILSPRAPALSGRGGGPGLSSYAWAEMSRSSLSKLSLQPSR